MKIVTKYMNSRHILVLACLALLFSSCDAWLDVKMKDKILENTLYLNEEGYTTALNGVYEELNSSEIYGRTLSMGEIDVMAQYYDVLTVKDHTKQIFGKYEFKQDGYISLFQATWTKMYNLLANVNLFLENCERPDAPLNSRLKSMISGEGYALRAMLHFDLLRLYGPTYTDETKSQLVMPYMNASDRVVRPLESSEVIIDKVLADFSRAAQLLKDSDPVIDEGPKNGSSVEDLNNDYNYRQYRLNYYAVKALMARAYMWKGDLENAKQCAMEITEVVEGEKAWFPFTTRMAVTSEVNPDRVFSSEVLFALYNTNRKNIYTGLFSKDLAAVTRLTLNGTYIDGRLHTLFNDEQDVRFSLWKSESNEEDVVLFSTQFMATTDPANQYMIPLLSVSEMYLILAECADTDIEAQNCLNKLRFARNAVDLVITEGTRDRNIAEEFAREMIGKGQLYLYYKRKGMTTIPDGSKKDGTISMPLDNYVWVIPDVELENRPQN